MTAALENAQHIDVSEWKSLNTASSPTKLQPGETPNAQNVWVDEKPGSLITANGYLKVGTLPSGNPPTFMINFFISSSGSQTFVVSDNSTVYTTTDFVTFTSIITGLSSSFQLRGMVVRDKLWLTNGSDSVRVYDGTSVSVLDGTAGTPNVPKGKFIAYFDERVWLYQISGARSKAAFSALTDTSGTVIAPDNANAWPSSNTLQISEGDADIGTGMVLYRGNLYLFKQYSIWRLVGYDEYTYTRVKTRASSGTRFNESIQICDNLVHFIGIDGIYVFDGEESVRISDLIDPASSDSTAFGFKSLAQPSQNTSFWETITTNDWNLGTVPNNIEVDNRITLSPADSGTNAFASGVTQTNIQTSNDILQLTYTTSGVSSLNLALNQAASMAVLSGGLGLTGSSSYLTDDNFTNICGFSGSPSGGQGNIFIPIPNGNNYTTIQLRKVTCGISILTFSINGATITPVSVSGGVSIAGGTVQTPVATDADFILTFAAFNPPTSLLVMNVVVGSNQGWTLSEFQVFTAAFFTTGKFVSRSLNLGLTPSSLGTFNATETLNGEGTSYFTQSSADGVTWDAEVACSNGGSIGSTPRQYVRWGVNFTSDGNLSAQITAVYLLSEYLSPVHDTNGSIAIWGAFESDYLALGNTLNFYYRGATSSAGVSGASWTAIVPGGTVNMSTSNRFIQFRVEFLGGSASAVPYVNSVTINWIIGSGTQSSVLQNVASFFWRNRYWLSATTGSASSNNIILIRGKKTFGSPWQLKDWQILSFCRYNDNFYGGSSSDGSIYLLDTGFSKNNSSMDSFFQTGDFTFGGFYIVPLEIIVEVERSGSYNLQVGVSIDRGTTWVDYPVDLTLSSFAPSYFKRLNIHTTTTDRIRFRYRIIAADQPFQLHNFKFYYSLEAERGSIK